MPPGENVIYAYGMISCDAIADPLVCTHPFEWLEVQQGGSLFLCCPAWLRRPIGVLGEAALGEIWNGPVAREVRASILNGTFHSCSRRRCPRRQTLTLPVQPLSRVADPVVAEAIRNGSVRLSYGPRRVNLCFDGRCNLQCPSCRKGAVYADRSEVERIDRLRALVEEEVAPQAVELRLSGHGDPFFAPSYRALLERIGPQRWPNLERLHLHTNGLLWTAERWQELAHLHPYVRTAEISIDAASPATYRNNRGGDWQLLQNNLAYLAGLPVALTLSMVVQQNTVREIGPFVAMAKGCGARVYLSCLVNWGTYDRQQYLSRAVHLPGHPEHERWKAALIPLLGDPAVDLGNLTAFVTGIGA